MNYIYDIILNFQDDYYDFYEWQVTDKIMNIKKIPIYKITNKDYLNLKYQNIIIERNSLPQNNRIFLVTSGIEVMGIQIDSNGKIIKRSSLIFEESDDILEDKEEISQINIKYSINQKLNITYISRIQKERISYIDNYLKNIDKIKDEYFLKYLYYDIYNTEENNIDKIYNNLVELSQNNITKIYNSLKRVTIELKK